jgi:hypothetical protein
MLIHTISTAILFLVVLGDAEPMLAQIRLRGLRNFENYLEQEADRHLQTDAPKEQGITTTFSASKLQKLRKKAAIVTEVPKDAPKGWSKSTVAPLKLVEVFAPLKLKKGVVLRAYQFKEGGNGNGVVWAMSADAEFPDPDQCPKVKRRDGFMMVPKPPAALDSIMEQVEGDSSAWSYMAASLLSRELWEFGAIWHGTNWGTYKILDSSPWKSTIFGNDDDPMGKPKTPEQDWKWLEAKPKHWRPRVTVEKDRVTVTFYTYSGYQNETICRHTDTYKPGSYRYESERKEIAQGGKGFVF